MRSSSPVGRLHGDIKYKGRSALESHLKQSATCPRRPSGRAMSSILHARDVSDEVSSHLADVRALAGACRELQHWTQGRRLSTIVLDVYLQVFKKHIAVAERQQSLREAVPQFAVLRASCQLLVGRYGAMYVGSLLVSGGITLCCGAGSDPETATEHKERLVSWALQSVAELVPRGCAELLEPFAFCLDSPSAAVRSAFLDLAGKTATRGDEKLVDPLLAVMETERTLDVRTRAAQVLCHVCDRHVRHRVVERVLPLLRAHRRGDDAGSAPLSVDKHAWFLESCFRLLSSATGDSRVRSSLVEFFVTEVGDLMQDPDFRRDQAAVLQDCLRALQSVGGLSPPELEAIAAALRSSFGSQDRALKRGVAALAPHDHALAHAVGWPGRRGPRGSRKKNRADSN